MGTSLNVFINNNTDENLVKAMMDKTKLTQKDVQVNTKNGVITRKQWVKIGEEPKEFQAKYREELKEKHSKKHEPFNPVNRHYEYTAFGKNGTTNSESKTYSLGDITSYYRGHKGIREKYQSLNKFILSNYYVDDGHSTTQKAYMNPDGTYKPARQALHNEIVKELVNGASKPPKGEKPVCFLYGGGSASGKGHIIKDVVEPQFEGSGLNYAVVDSDEIKKSIPEYKRFQDKNPNSAALRAHNESSDIANEAIDAMIKEGKCFAFDGTMKSYDKYDKLIGKLKDAGYTINIVGVTIPVKDAIKRSDARAKKTKRKVPHGIIQSTHGGFSLTLPKLMDRVDSVSLYDNSQKEGEPATLILDNSGVKNQEMYDSFLKKGDEWIKQKEKDKKEKANKGGNKHGR